MHIVFYSKGTSFTQRKVEKGFCFFHSQKLWCTIEYHPNKYILLSVWAIHEVPPWKIAWFMKASDYLKHFAFQGFDMDMFF